MTDADIDRIVSDHAALAYLRRVRGMKIEDLSGITSTVERLRAERIVLAHECETIGLVPLDVKRKIMTPRVAAAFVVGADKIRTTEFVVCIHPNGYIATVLEPGGGYAAPRKGKGRRRVPRRHEERFR